MKIWCLFSIENLYDQPGNNLVTWWVNKPDNKQLIKAISSMVIKIEDEELLVKQLHSGDEVRVSIGTFGGYDFRLKEIEEGIVDENI